MKANVNAAAFTRLLGDVLPFAGEDDTLPMLTVVHLELVGDMLTASATDRYALAQSRTRVQITDDDGNPVEHVGGVVNLSRLDAKRVIANFAPAKRSYPLSQGARLSLNLMDDTVVIGQQRLHIAPADELLFLDSARVTMECSHLDYQFPKVEGLIPKVDEVAVIGLAPKYLMKAAARRRDKHHPLRIILGGRHKPVRIMIGSAEDADELRVLIMPTRNADETDDWE